MQNAKSVFQPKAGAGLRALGVARISRETQDVLSLADQEALYRRWLDQNVGSRYDLLMIAGQGSGECLDRAEYLEAWAQVETGRFDLVITEDLGRVARRVHAIQFIENCEDHNTRFIAINDNIDTADENWRVLASVASMRHELYNADTAKRIRRSLRNRFSNGGIIQFVIFGYIKPPGAKSDAELHKDPAAEQIYEQIFRMLEADASFWEVADWLNEKGIRPGPYARLDRWDGRMLARVVFNPILKGVRVRNNRMSKRKNAKGRRKSVKAPPSERLERHCPHLAFIDADRYDRLIAKLTMRSEKYKRASKSGIDVRANIPRKRTVFPGQFALCGVCGRLMYWGGHGQATHMMCAGARDYQCWNTCSFDGLAATESIVLAILDRIERLPNFDDEFRQRVEAQARVKIDESYHEEARARADECALTAKLDRLVEYMLLSPQSESLTSKLRELECRLVEIRSERAEIRSRRAGTPEMPAAAELKDRVRNAITSVARDDPEFARVMRKLVSQILIYPFQPMDSGRVVARAHIKLDLTTILPESLAEATESVLVHSFWVDLFAKPAHIEFMHRFAEARAEPLTERQIAARFGFTQPIVQKSLALLREMQLRAIANPYLMLTSPPDDNPKFRVHRHRRYHFEPLPGFPVWPDIQFD